jgi:methionyl-tRNA synthetase
VADQYSASFHATWQQLGFSFDRFIRTTDPDHARTVQAVLQRLWDQGEIDFREYEGLYCVGCERFLAERDMEGGLCRDHERAPERRREANYFFQMSRYFEWLIGHIEKQPDFIRPERYRNETLGMLRDAAGLGDLCISRPKSRLEWGIELPFDAGFVCYVWFDALLNYLSGIGYPDGSDFASLWAGAEHFVGKDILKPHAVFWPAMLKALGLPPYRHLNVHGYWNVDARKVSKSLGNMVAPLAMRDRYGFDAFRYFLLREMVFGLDASFSEEALIARINADLANNLGNLVSRTLNMTARFAGGKVPEPGEADEAARSVSDAASFAGATVDACLRRNEFHRALEAVFQLVDTVNRYLEERAPWKSGKDPAMATQTASALYTSCESLRVIALLLAPFLPETSPELLSRLGLQGALAGARFPEALRWGGLRPGTPTRQGNPLFPRIERAPGEP